MFYTRFCNLAIENNSTPTAVVLKLGMSKSNLAHWRNGHSPTGEVLLKVADYFGVSIDYLLGRTENPEVNK